MLKIAPNCQSWFYENRTTETEFLVFEFLGLFGCYKTDIRQFHRVLHTYRVEHVLLVNDLLKG